MYQLIGREEQHLMSLKVWAKTQKTIKTKLWKYFLMWCPCPFSNAAHETTRLRPDNQLIDEVMATKYRVRSWVPTTGLIYDHQLQGEVLATCTRLSHDYRNYYRTIGLGLPLTTGWGLEHQKAGWGPGLNYSMTSWLPTTGWGHDYQLRDEILTIKFMMRS
jgi:hypothetical protein